MTRYTDNQKRAIALMVVCIISTAALIYLVVTNSMLMAAIHNADVGAFVENVRAMTIRDLTLYSATLLASIGTLILAVTIYRHDVVSALAAMANSSDDAVKRVVPADISASSGEVNAIPNTADGLRYRGNAGAGGLLGSTDGAAAETFTN